MCVVHLTTKSCSAPCPLFASYRMLQYLASQRRAVTMRCNNPLATEKELWSTTGEASLWQERIVLPLYPSHL